MSHDIVVIADVLNKTDKTNNMAIGEHVNI